MIWLYMGVGVGNLPVCASGMSLEYRDELQDSRRDTRKASMPNRKTSPPSRSPTPAQKSGLVGLSHQAPE